MLLKWMPVKRKLYSKREKKYGIIPIHISGYIDNPLVLEGMQRPGIHFIQKPFEPSVIIKKVREVLDSH
jgi:FixJ family two-component response regulator